MLQLSRLLRILEAIYSIIICQHIYSNLRCGKITPKKTSIVKFYKNGVQFKDGSVEQCDAVVFCTGFKPEFEYFEKSVLQTIKFDEKNEKMPIVMYKHTVHPDLPNLGIWILIIYLVWLSVYSLFMCII